MSVTLTEFLLARIAEDEAVAEANVLAGFDWFVRVKGRVHQVRRHPHSSRVADAGREECAHIARHNPTRVLAECGAKRRIVERHVARNGAEDWMDAEWLADMTPQERAGVCGWCTYDNRRVWFPCPDLRDLASVYADHPDYREEWRT